MPKQKTRNTFYWITWEVNTAQLMLYYKRKNYQNFCKNCDLKTSSRPFCVCKKSYTTAIGK